MPADQIRNRTVGCKMTDSEYERLSAVVETEGMTLGEWVREVLLERVDGRKPSVIEETLLAEVLALRTILLNLHFTAGGAAFETGLNFRVAHLSRRVTGGAFDFDSLIEAGSSAFDAELNFGFRLSPSYSRGRWAFHFRVSKSSGLHRRTIYLLPEPLTAS
jgi:hypothetical protein